MTCAWAAIDNGVRGFRVKDIAVTDGREMQLVRFEAGAWSLNRAVRTARNQGGTA